MKDRSLVKGSSESRELLLQKEHLLWGNLIYRAVYEAKKTKDGLPTDLALLSRYWIEKERPARESLEWETSFEAACHWLSRDPEVERRRMVAEIDSALLEAYVSHVRRYAEKRAARVLSCVGVTPPSGKKEPPRRLEEEVAASGDGGCVVLEVPAPTLESLVEPEAAMVA